MIPETSSLKKTIGRKKNGMSHDSLIFVTRNYRAKKNDDGARNRRNGSGDKMTSVISKLG